MRSIGLNAGLHSVGVTSVDPLDRAREQIQQRIDNDFVNDMQFTFRNPVRSTTPSLIVQDARTIIVGAYSYFVEDADEGLGTPAHIARYAWFDAHHQMREALTAMKDQLRADGHRAVVLQMTTPSLIERLHIAPASVGLARMQTFLFQGRVVILSWAVWLLRRNFRCQNLLLIPVVPVPDVFPRVLPMPLQLLGLLMRIDACRGCYKSPESSIGVFVLHLVVVFMVAMIVNRRVRIRNGGLCLSPCDHQ